MKNKNKLKELKLENLRLKEKVIYAQNENEVYKTILNTLINIFSPDTSSYVNKLTFAKLPYEVMELYFYRKMHEGARYPSEEIVQSQREIIRWLIKPSTAEKPTGEVIDEFRKKGIL